MPYIKLQRRVRLEPAHIPAENSGDLAYALCDQINAFLKATPNGGFEGAISKVYGALDAAKFAFEQDVVLPYERRKKAENGPVFNIWPSDIIAEGWHQDSDGLWNNPDLEVFGRQEPHV